MKNNVFFYCKGARQKIVAVFRREIELNYRVGYAIEQETESKLGPKKSWSK